MMVIGLLDNCDELGVRYWRWCLEAIGKTFMIMSCLVQWWWYSIGVLYVIRLRRWWYDECDEMSWLCELWYHVKGMMIQGWVWNTCVPYYDMTMMCWSH